MTMPRRRLNPDGLKPSTNGFKPSPAPLDETGTPVLPSPEPHAACPNPIRADLKAYADGALSIVRRASVRRHLRNCPACREELADMKKIADLFSDASLATDANAALAPQLRSRVLSQLDNLAPVSPIGGTVRPAPLWRRQPALVFGGGGSVLAASLAIFYTMNTSVHAPSASTGAIGVAGTLSYVQDYDEKSPSAAKDDALRSNSEVDVTTATPNAPAATAAAPAASFRAPDMAAGALRAGTVRGRQGTVQNQAYTESQMEQASADKSFAAPVSRRAAPLSAAKVMPRNAPGSVFGSATASSDVSMEAEDGRQVHKEASLGLRVAPNGLQTASDKIEELVKSTGGFVASNNLTTDDATGEKSADLAVRVPVKDFETVMASLAKMGNVVSKQITGEDITEKTTDATTAEQVLVNEATETARKLANQSMSERRTGQKEAELRQIRMQLAQTRARLGLLRRMGSLSTINISLTEKQVPKTPGTVTPKTGSFFNGMQETNKAAMQAFQTAVRVPIVLLIWVLAFSPIWVPLVIAYRWASLKSLANRVTNTGAASGDTAARGEKSIVKKRSSFAGAATAALAAIVSLAVASPGYAQTAQDSQTRWRQKAEQSDASPFHKKAYQQIALLAVAAPPYQSEYGGVNVKELRAGSEKPASVLAEMGLPVLPILADALSDTTQTKIVTFGKSLRQNDKGKTWRVNELVALVLVGIVQHDFVVYDGKNPLTLRRDVAERPELVPAFQKAVLAWYEQNKNRTLTERKIADVSDGWFRNRLDAVEWLGAHKERKAVPALVCYANTIFASKEKNSLQDAELAETTLALGQIGDKATLPVAQKACRYLAAGLKRYGVTGSMDLLTLFQASQGRALLGDAQNARRDLKTLYAQCAANMDSSSRTEFQERLKKAANWSD